MPSFKISTIEETFSLDKTDAEYGLDPGSTHVRIRQASQSANERIEALYNLVETRYNDLEPSLRIVQQKFSITALHRTEAFLTMVSCDVEDEDGKLLFDDKTLKNEELFKQAWGKLPPLVCNEIIECIFKVNVSWNPNQGEVL